MMVYMYRAHQENRTLECSRAPNLSSKIRFPDFIVGLNVYYIARAECYCVIVKQFHLS